MDSISSLYIPDQYICTLSEELQKFAKKELREDERSRDQALEQMRDWIAKTDYVADCRVDSNFLLRFLRAKKFSVPMAQETLLRYISMRQQHPLWYHNCSINDPMIRDLVNRGVAFALPKRDKAGRRVMFTIGGNIDPSYHTAEGVMRAIMLTFESFLEDEETQIRGFSHVLDESGITLSHLVLWNPTEIARIFGISERAMPMRHKRLDFVRLPTLLNYIYEVLTNFMSEKMRSRIRLHKDSSHLCDGVDLKILPKEYGGEMPLADMIQLFKEEIAPRNERVEELDRMCLDLDLMKKSTTAPKKLSSDIMGMTGSFKRLEID